jgi:hypothetical protein
MRRRLALRLWAYSGERQEVERRGQSKPGTGANTLNAVQAISTDNVWAVGDFSIPRMIDTLTEFNSWTKGKKGGETPSIVAVFDVLVTL